MVAIIMTSGARARTSSLVNRGYDELSRGQIDTSGHVDKLVNIGTLSR